MAKTVEEAKKKLDDEYGQVRRKFDRSTPRSIV